MEFKTAKTLDDLSNLLYYTVENNGSDLHLAVGAKPKFRKYGALMEIPGWNIINSADASSMFNGMLDAYP